MNIKLEDCPYCGPSCTTWNYDMQYCRKSSPAIEIRQRVERDIYDERLRQISDEGWSLANDDRHTAGELACAAACYAIAGALPGEAARVYKRYWPWDKRWFKPKSLNTSSPGGARRDLVRAAALIVAEIERLDRAAALAISQGANT